MMVEEAQLSEEEIGLVEKAQQIIREISLEKMIDQTSDELSISEHPNKDASIFDHWLSIILLSSRKVKIAFKIHYNSKTGFKILDRKRKVDEKTQITQVFDFLKEYCNLTGGGIKEALKSENGKTGLSLPLTTRGFDEVLFTDRSIKSGKKKFRDIWRLDCGDYKVTCSSEIQVLDWDCLKEFEKVVRTDDEEGDLEFL